MRHSPRVVNINYRKRESANIISIEARDQKCAAARPGQFAMLWIPGIDEIPMSVFPIKDDVVMFTFKIVGEATKSLASKKIGDKIGIRGPYGTYFRTRKKGPFLLVGGGTGIVPLAFFLRFIANRGDTTFLIGGRTRSRIIYLDHIRKIQSRDARLKIIVSTDDGTSGRKGLASDIASALLEKNRYEEVFTCGPEQMILSLYHECERRHIPIQASLERIMKCGVGVCGSCCLGRYLVCKDGPVFRRTYLHETIDELGKWKRNHSGNIVRM